MAGDIIRRIPIVQEANGQQLDDPNHISIANTVLPVTFLRALNAEQAAEALYVTSYKGQLFFPAEYTLAEQQTMPFERMIETAKKLRIPVIADINNRAVIVDPSDTLEAVCDSYNNIEKDNIESGMDAYNARVAARETTGKWTQQARTSKPHNDCLGGPGN